MSPTKLITLTLGLGLAITASSQSFLTNGLVAYYPFSGDANDAVGTNHGGVFGATLSSDRFGNPNHAYSFNGTTAYIDCPDTGFPSGNAPRSVTFWMNISSAANTYPFSYGDNRRNDAFYAIVTTSSEIAVGNYGGGDAPSYLIGANVWTHIAITYSDTNVTLYVNGSQHTQATRSYETTLSGHFFIGRFLAGFPPTFYGAIDEVRVYDRELSSQDVLSLYEFEFLSGTGTGLIKAVKPKFGDLFIGTNYQLQVSTDLKTWANEGSPFTATNSLMFYSQYFEVDTWNQLFFRVEIAQ